MKASLNQIPRAVFFEALYDLTSAPNDGKGDYYDGYMAAQNRYIESLKELLPAVVTVKAEGLESWK